MPSRDLSSWVHKTKPAHLGLHRFILIYSQSLER